MRLALHVHSDYSPCSESPLQDIYDYCKEHDIGAIAICDHNEIAGALRLRELARDLIVIIGEEIKTRQGEIIGLFLSRRIEPMLSIEETIDRIKEQDGLVLLPHPFDIIRPFHLRPATLAKISRRVDMVEIFNSKMLLRRSNKKALWYAKSISKTGVIGSDAHYVKAIGSAIMEIDDFTGPGDFLAKIREARIVRAKDLGVLTTIWSCTKKFARGITGNHPKRDK
ncbi:MAG: PHP domain-containing protein [Abditibacteriota bacterium]|nr:PHP domain-containing protein [Abditibacteriota bacterium]